MPHGLAVRQPDVDPVDDGLRVLRAHMRLEDRPCPVDVARVREAADRGPVARDPTPTLAENAPQLHVDVVQPGA